MTTLTNARILTMDAAMTEIRNGWIRIDGARIAAMGEGPAPDADALDMGGDLVMPGMVNSHCHMTMTLFRGLGEDVHRDHGTRVSLAAGDLRRGAHAN